MVIRKFIFTFLSLLFVQLSVAQSIIRCDNEKYICYKNSDGKTIVKSKKYTIAFTDTITSIGFVGNRKGEIICIDNHGKELFEVYKIDNGPDYVSDGMVRIIGKKGKIGFADTCGVIVIPPVFSYATPFRDGEAKVTFEGESQKQGEYQSWKSNHWFLIEKPTSIKPTNASMGKVTEISPVDTLTMVEKYQVREIAAQVPDSVKTHFYFLLYKWNYAIAHNRKILLSSNTCSYKELPEFHALESMGSQIIPLVMEQLMEPSNFHLLVLYEAVQKDSSKIIKANIGGEQNRAIKCVKKWLKCKEYDI